MKLTKTQLHKIIKEEWEGYRVSKKYLDRTAAKEEQQWTAEMEQEAKDSMQQYGEIPNLDISVENNAGELNFIVRIAKEEAFEDAEAMRTYLDAALDRHWSR